jgi:hypothetical protein
MANSVLGSRPAHKAIGCIASLGVCAISGIAHASIDSDGPVKAAQSFELDDLSKKDRYKEADTLDRGGPRYDNDAVARQLEVMANELHEQRALIAQQSQVIARQQAAIDQLMGQSTADSNLAMMRATGVGQAGGQAGSAQSAPPPNQPVGVAPPEDHVIAAEVTALPQGAGVLTPRGEFVLESSFDYTRTSKNRLVFRGFELIPGIQVGLIEASDADRDTMVGTVSLRTGITNRLEIEARMPVLARQDRIQVVQQRDEGIVRTIKLNDYYIGDAEIGLRYQLNDAHGPDEPIFVANLRVKSNTGRGPFDIGYDEFGVATGLATGSGFWGVQGGMSFLIPSDPVVLYGGAGYLYHIPAKVNKLVGGALIGKVDPGDAISANVGFGFALNSRFSFSLGYSHSYILPTKTEIGGTNQRSTSLHVGSFGVGTSFRTSDRTSVNIAFEFGMTSDAPDVSMTLRLPLRF